MTRTPAPETEAELTAWYAERCEYALRVLAEREAELDAKYGPAED